MGPSTATDDAVNRLYSINDNSGGSPTPLASYQYLGLDTVVQQNYKQPGLTLDHVDSSTIGTYNGLNKFNQVIDQLWSKAGSSPVDELQYGYDEAGNVLYKLNVVADDLAATGDGTPYLDELYTYNAVSELTEMQRGEINGSSIASGTPTLSSPANLTQTWNLDGTGNWSTYTSTPSTTGGTGSSASETRRLTAATRSWPKTPRPGPPPPASSPQPTTTTAT